MISRVCAIIAVSGFCMIAAPATELPVAATPWFTQSKIGGSVVAEHSKTHAKVVPGTEQAGILLTDTVEIENPCLAQSDGYIAFWIKPDWDGDDNQRHKILQIGDPETNGLLLEKSPQNMLRFVMASPEKQTASRADVSKWKAGEWHHVVIGWFTRKDQPIGLPLWIDKVAVAGPIAGGCTFLNPEKMANKNVRLGDKTSQCSIDELIFRPSTQSKEDGKLGMAGTVYRDYFRSAPYTAIKITHEPNRVPSDKRVVKDCRKQFGVMAKMEGKWTYITDFVTGYESWGYFDAKPFITWTTSDESVATVINDKNLQKDGSASGCVEGHKFGRCVLSAEFRGMKDTYDIEVISADQPDLDLLYVEWNPKLNVHALKNQPEAGDNITTTVAIGNFGFKPVPAGTEVTFEFLPDTNRNYVLDPEEKVIATQRAVVDEIIEPGEQTTVEFKWEYPEEPVWVRVTLDPENKLPEICEANNQRCELSIARPMRWSFEEKYYSKCMEEKYINHVGSFSMYDWINGQADRFAQMLRDTVTPETTPVGIQDCLRTDKIFLEREGLEWSEQDYEKFGDVYDGGHPIRDREPILSMSSGALHEFGHTAVALPDLYGYPLTEHGLLLKDENGNDYVRTPIMPIVQNDLLMAPSGLGDVPCIVGYQPLMTRCHLWFHPVHAGFLQYDRRFRGQRFWAKQGMLIPAWENWLQVYDIEDKPLIDAEVYVYQVWNPPVYRATSKYFYDRPKFLGNTNEEGAWRFPEYTDEGWDDPATDEVEGRYPVGINPFGVAVDKEDAFYTMAFTPNVWGLEGLFLVKIAYADQVEFKYLDLTDFNAEFFRGNRLRGVYPIRTSLKPTGKPQTAKAPEVPANLKETNLRPIANISHPDMVAKTNEEGEFDHYEITVVKGDTLEVKSVDCKDPEGQPLMYRWEMRSRNFSKEIVTEPNYVAEARNEGECEMWFYVIDGVRISEPIKIVVKVIPDDKLALN